MGYDLLQFQMKSYNVQIRSFYTQWFPLRNELAIIVEAKS